MGYLHAHRKNGHAYTDASHVPSLLLWAGIQFLIAGFLTVGIYSIISRELMLPKKKNIKGVAIVSMLQTVALILVCVGIVLWGYEKKR